MITINQTNPQRPDGELPREYVWSTGMSISSGWWPVVSIITLLCHGMLFSWVGLIVLLPGEVIAMLLPLPLFALFSWPISAADRARMGSLSTSLFGMFMVLVIALDVIVIIYLVPFLSAWLATKHR